MYDEHKENMHTDAFRYSRKVLTWLCAWSRNEPRDRQTNERELNGQMSVNRCSYWGMMRR